MKCPKCNKIYEDGTVFCGECGSYIGEVKDDNMDKTMAIPVIKDYERVYNAPKSTPQKQSAKAPAQRESTPRTNTPPVRKVREQKENPVETSSKQKNILVFVIAFLVVVIIALATILGFMAIDSMKENNVDNGESVSSAVNAPKEEKKNTKDDKAKEEEETEEEEKEEATMEGEPGKIDRDADFDFAYGLNPGNADRSYTTLTNGDLSYKCALPSDFKFKSDSGDRLRYVAKDKTAYIDIGGVKNGNKLSTQAVMANAKSDIGGTTVYESSGDDWFAVNMEKDGICYYQMCYVDEYIRYFEMVFPKEYADAYETYVEEISDSFVRTE
jgi:hypothetical protein